MDGEYSVKRVCRVSICYSGEDMRFGSEDSRTIIEAVMKGSQTEMRFESKYFFFDFTSDAEERPVLLSCMFVHISTTNQSFFIQLIGDI